MIIHFTTVRKMIIYKPKKPSHYPVQIYTLVDPLTGIVTSVLEVKNKDEVDMNLEEGSPNTDNHEGGPVDECREE